MMDINIIGSIDGIELAKIIEEKYGIPYIYVTSYSDVETLRKINETHPLGYILKPFDQRDIRVALDIGFTKMHQDHETDKPKSTDALANKGAVIIGESSGMQEAMKKVRQVAKTDVTVLIHGETGTGKELFMQAIHDHSPRRSKSLVKVNCAALPSELIESVLFGHEKGSFTGASEKRIGKFELANEGTLFLDEIGELPLMSQSKLLRCLQEKEIETIGGTQPKKVDVRIVAATNRDLASEVALGKFRADLFYRLNVFPVHIPPLRARKEDIPLIAQFCLKQISKKLEKKVAIIDAETLESLKSHEWPGNVRELMHCIERGVIMAESNVLKVTPENIGMGAETADPQAFELKSLEEAEKERIIKTLEYCNWKVRGSGGAAEILKIHPNTLDLKIKKMGIKRES